MAVQGVGPQTALAVLSGLSLEELFRAVQAGEARRFHGIPRVIAELEHHLSRLPFIRFVAFGDDDFFVRPKAQLEEFAEAYKKRIGLPFGVAVSARTYRKDKMEVLLDAGLTGIQMGVQSASQRVLRDIYQRTISISAVKAAAAEIGSYITPRGLNLHLDFIVDNPYESRADVAKTLRYILELPWEAKLNVFTLAYFPGTPLYDRALADGLIRPYSQQAYRPYTRSRLRYQRNWETFLIQLLRVLRIAVKRRGTTLGTALQLLASRPMRTAMAAVPAPVFAALSRLLQAGVKRILKSGDPARKLKAAA